MSRAHRVIWAEANGSIPAGMFVLHKCDTPPCINLEHLYLGTHADNMADKVARNRCRNQHDSKTHCKHGHPLSGDNLYLRGKWRVCRICNAAAARKYRSEHT